MSFLTDWTIYATKAFIILQDECGHVSTCTWMVEVQVFLYTRLEEQLLNLAGQHEYVKKANSLCNCLTRTGPLMKYSLPFQYIYTRCACSVDRPSQSWVN